MTTAAERRAAADARAKEGAASPPPPEGGEGDGSTPGYDADLLAMDLPALRTEAKRLLGPDYDHAMDQDVDSLRSVAQAARIDRATYYAQQAQARKDAARAAYGD